MKKMLGFFFAFLLSLSLFAQETGSQGGTLLLINGKTIPFKLIESNGYDLVYRTPAPKNKLKKIDPERVFSIQYIDGSERVIFQRDTLDPLEFTVEEMRLFIKGEQDADRLYHNNLNKVGGFAAGVVSSYFGFYDVIGSPIYATVF